MSPRLAYLVWRRNLAVYLKTWLVNFLPPFLEPLIYLTGFGFGVGALMKDGRVQGVPYANFIAPGMVAVAVMQQAFFECSYGSFIRMYYQKTFDALLATPCTLEDVAAGEMAWGATKALISAAIMLPILAAFGLLGLPGSLWMLPAALLAGWAFSALAFCVAARVPHIDAFNLPMFLFIMPMFALGETFFPLPASGWMQAVGNWMPLTHLSRLCRAASLGQLDPSHALLVLGGFAAAGLLLSLVGTRWMRRRLIP